MESLAWVLILSSALIGRQVIVGRASNLRQDTHDFFLAAFRGDGAALSEVSKRRGKSSAQVASDALTTSSPNTSIAGAQAGTALIAEMKKLASAANNHYRWGAIGPDAYDCSGLVWRACKNLNLYSGPRFVTSTFGAVSKGFAEVVPIPELPQPGDVCVWPIRHMGVVVGKDRMFSALSTKAGITESSISAESGTPTYYRIKTFSFQK